MHTLGRAWLKIVSWLQKSLKFSKISFSSSTQVIMKFEVSNSSTVPSIVCFVESNLWKNLETKEPAFWAWCFKTAIYDIVFDTSVLDLKYKLEELVYSFISITLGAWLVYKSPCDILVNLFGGDYIDHFALHPWCSLCLITEMMVFQY